MSSDNRFNHLSLHSLENSDVLLNPPIIFACGGVVDVQLPEPLSARGYFIQYINSTNSKLQPFVRLAEDFKDWLHDSKYSDLQTFENDLAHLSSLVLIFLESTGAFVELGLFATNEDLIKKLVIFISQDHYDSDSFIKLGPLRYIDNKNKKSIYSYPWSYENLKSTIVDYLHDIAEDVESVLNKCHKTEKFCKDNPGHISFIIFEVILIFRALKYTEISKLLQCLDLDISNADLSRFLFLIEKLELISKKHIGDIDFYYPLVKDSRVKLALKSKDKKIDKNAMTLSAMQYYSEDENERHRRAMLKSINSGAKDEL